MAGMKSWSLLDAVQAPARQNATLEATQHRPWPLPFVSSFFELNTRTYVTAHGKPGIWFLSLNSAPPGNTRPLLARDHASPEATLALAKAVKP